MAKTYEIKEVLVPEWQGSLLCYTVVETVDGVATGGDSHWLHRDFAELALAAYERGEATHPHYVVPAGAIDWARFTWTDPPRD